jgi:hypothetical protein
MSPTGHAWRKSSYSTSTGNCVEVTETTGCVLIRHSKNPAAGTISFSPLAWAAFVRDAASEDGPTSTNGVATITRIGTDTLVRSVASDVELVFDHGEWSAFLAGAAQGEFEISDEYALPPDRVGGGQIHPTDGRGVHEVEARRIRVTVQLAR